MNFHLFEEYFSSHRVSRYFIASDYSRRKAQKLYKSNLRIAKSFHPLLGILEVVLRNRINQVLSEHFSDQNWILNQRKGFMSDGSLKYTDKRTGKINVNDFLKSEVNKAEKRLQKGRRPISSSRIIAEQNFGFWTELFEVHHYKILKGKPIQVFKNLPSGIGRKQIAEELNRIRRFRNRINHNEPICFVDNSVDFSETNNIHNSILNLLSWIDIELVEFVRPVDNVSRLIELSTVLHSPK